MFTASRLTSMDDPFRQRNPSRREVLQTATAGAGALMLANPANAFADNSVAGLIDAHVHVWTPDTRRYPLASGFAKEDMKPASFTPEQFMAHAKPNGVTRIVLIQMSFYRYDNSYMLRVMHEHAGVYSGVAVIDPNDRPRERMKKLSEKGVRGFRIRPHEQKPDVWLSGDGMKAMWKCGADEGLAMCHLINPEFLLPVGEMCRQYPKTPVVIDHFARIGIDGKIRGSDLDNLCRLARYEHVSVKISAYYALGRKQQPYRDLGAMIRRLREAFGSERLMWASDCPFQVQEKHTYKASIDLIKEGLDFLTASDRDWLLRKTAQRVFFAS